MKQRENVNYFKALKISNRKLLFEKILGHDLKNEQKINKKRVTFV
jgi:hypothetical protein